MMTQACPSEVLPIGRGARECRTIMIGRISGQFEKVDGIFSQGLMIATQRSRGGLTSKDQILTQTQQL